MVEPEITFSDWRPWDLRESTSNSDLLDFVAPPKDFDIGGIYLLGRFRAPPVGSSTAKGARHLDENVVYIGMSTRITGRLEGSKHEKVRQDYRKLFADDKLQFLYHTIWYSAWTTWQGWNSESGKVRKAFLLFSERRLIWEYARQFKRLPPLNKQ